MTAWVKGQTESLLTFLVRFKGASHHLTLMGNYQKSLSHLFGDGSAFFVTWA